jgi:hypothetical protein
MSLITAKPAHGIPVKGEIPGGDLGFVPRSQYQPTELIGEGHEKRAPHTGLEVFFRHIQGAPRETGGPRFLKRLNRVFNSNGKKIDVQVFR